MKCRVDAIRSENYETPLPQPQPNFSIKGKSRPIPNLSKKDHSKPPPRPPTTFFEIEHHHHNHNKMFEGKLWFTTIVPQSYAHWGHLALFWPPLPQK